MDISIVISGEAGQGIQAIETILSKLFLSADLCVFATKEYMSRIRGGVNSTQIRISDNKNYPPRSSCEKIDILIALNSKSLEHLRHRINSNTLVIGDKKFYEDGINYYSVDFDGPALEIGHKIYSNIIAAGFIAGFVGIIPENSRDLVNKLFKGKDDKIIENNNKALAIGLTLGKSKKDYLKWSFNFKHSFKHTNNNILINGSDGVSYGALLGGCNFIAAYPMTPGTQVFANLIREAKDFGIIAEQAEDEISAINMIIGAAYAGAKAMTSTSGGGFALMQEGVSLAGMLETPIVIHLAQRPGPATGLPTRTEQGDLNFAIYSGHGDFPKIVFAPSNIEECFTLTQRGFDLAQKHQIPVIILTDQYLTDSYYNSDFHFYKNEISEHTNKKTETTIVKTTKDYNRYALTKNGISPRGIPNFGDGLVTADSDEHNENGRITESANVRNSMVEKRLLKIKNLQEDLIKPELEGDLNSKNLILSWGSTYYAINEFIYKNTKNFCHLHISEIFPVNKDIEAILKSKDFNIIAIEQNATGQFADLIQKEFCIPIKKRILKYDGLQITKEFIEAQMEKFI